VSTLGATSGMPDVAPRVDTDGATQQFEGASVFGGATAAIPNTQIGESQAAVTEPPQPAAASTPAPAPPPPATDAPPKKPVALIAAAVAAVVIGGGGTMFMLKGGDETTPAGNQIALNTGSEPGGVSQDTAVLGSNPNNGRSGPEEPAPADPGVRIETDTGSSEVVSPPPSIDMPDDPLVTTPAISVDVANAAEAVINQMIASDGLSDSIQLASIRDTVQAYYNNQQVDRNTRADAAYVTAMTYFQAGQRTEGLRWVRTAIDLNPSEASYQRLLQDNRGNA
jgi:hypothetical protein